MCSKDVTISRDAAIDEICDIRCGKSKFDCESYKNRNYISDCDYIRSLLNLPFTQLEQRWIPCSERLPGKEKKTYWVCTDTEYQCECRWTNNRFGLGEGEWGWSIFDTPQYSKPIAWMPLPAPYRKEGEEGEEG